MGDRAAAQRRFMAMLPMLLAASTAEHVSISNPAEVPVAAHAVTLHLLLSQAGSHTTGFAHRRRCLWGPDRERSGPCRPRRRSPCHQRSRSPLTPCTSAAPTPDAQGQDGGQPTRRPGSEQTLGWYQDPERILCAAGWDSAASSRSALICRRARSGEDAYGETHLKPGPKPPPRAGWR